MKLKRLIVIGAGGVGGSIGGLLAEAGFPVVLVARGAHGLQIRNHGLCVQLPNRTFRVQPPCFEQIHDVAWKAGDLVMLSMKLQDAKAAMDELAASAGNQLPVVCASNGVHGERWATSRFENVLSMLVWLPATHLEPGQVRLHAEGCSGVLDTGPATMFAEEFPEAWSKKLTTSKSIAPPATASANHDRLCRELCSWLRRVNFDALVREDIRQWKLAKWITNLGGTAQAMVVDDWQTVASVAQAEGEKVLTAAAVSRIATQTLLDRTAHVQALPIHGRERQGGSTWQSRYRGRPLESRWIEGAMADLAAEVGVAADVNRFLADASLAPRSLFARQVLQVDPMNRQ